VASKYQLYIPSEEQLLEELKKVETERKSHRSLGSKIENYQSNNQDGLQLQ